ncbi:MAG TPA: D-alanine--D-alanine ligase [Polyangia bacterium]|nr:D-alanine--D-alanine ligase [Polyangia bacterium]
MKKARVLVLFDTDGEPPASQDYKKQIESTDEAEFDVARALIGKGHDVRMFGFRDNVDQLVAGLKADRPDVVFNLSERFRGQSALDYTVAALMEMLGLPYTGASSEGLILSRDKALTKKVFAYQGIRIPHFMVCKQRVTVQRPSDLRFPLIVKPLDEDASVGIAQSSVVRDDDALKERVLFIHERFKTDAIVEEFIAGRELYIGVMGNDPPVALPPIEMVFGGAESASNNKIATFKAKWSVRYRESRGIQNMIAEGLSAEVRQRLAEVALRAYEAAGLRDYGRIDVRLAHDDAIYIVEANPNPYLADGEDLAWAAEEAGNLYPDFIEKIAEMAIIRGVSRG